MKIISWNVNGFRAILKKNFLDFFNEQDADIFCIQETKMQEGQIDIEFEGYHQYWNSAEKKGYSGVAFFVKKQPLNVTYGMNSTGHPNEGRIITLEYADFFMVGAYVPNSQTNLRRLDYRMDWEDDMRTYLATLNDSKPVIYCGDLNVAHNEIDLANPDDNHKSAGFSDEERAKFTQLLDAGFVDTFRHFYPTLTNRYSYWSYRTRARDRNVGWRIDYFVVSEDILEVVNDSLINDDILGSDHCPVTLLLDKESLGW